MRLPSYARGLLGRFRMHGQSSTRGHGAPIGFSARVGFELSNSPLATPSRRYLPALADWRARQAVRRGRCRAATPSTQNLYSPADIRGARVIWEFRNTSPKSIPRRHLEREDCARTPCTPLAGPSGAPPTLPGVRRAHACGGGRQACPGGGGESGDGAARVTRTRHPTPPAMQLPTLQLPTPGVPLARLQHPRRASFAIS